MQKGKIKEDKILRINVFDGDDGIQYIRYSDLEKILNKIYTSNLLSSEELHELTEWVCNKDKEIERLNNIIKEIDNAFKYENLHNNMELVREIKRILINEYYKGVDKE